MWILALHTLTFSSTKKQTFLSFVWRSSFSMRRYTLCSKSQNTAENTILYEVEWFGMIHGIQLSEIVLISKISPFLVIIEKQKFFFLPFLLISNVYASMYINRIFFDIFILDWELYKTTITCKIISLEYKLLYFSSLEMNEFQILITSTRRPN